MGRHLGWIPRAEEPAGLGAGQQFRQPAAGCRTAGNVEGSAISGERVASAIASRNIAITEGWDPSRSRFIAKAVSVAASICRLSGIGNPGGSRIRSARLLMQATSIACLLPKFA